MGPKKKYVLDTSTIIYDPKAIFAFKEHDVIIPIEVIVELDNHKNGSDTSNYNAREALRIIGAMPPEKIYDGGYSLGKGLGNLRIVTGHTYQGPVKVNFAEETMDHKILNAAYCLAHVKGPKGPPPEVILVTKDVNLRIKAGALKGLVKAEDYKNGAIQNTNSFFDNYKEFKVSESVISELYTKGRTIIPGKMNFRENEFAILNPENDEPTLVTFRQNQLHLISEKEGAHLFGIKPKNMEQRFAVNALLNREISLIAMSGKAGTGKTLLALAVALYLMKQKAFSHLFLTREVIGLSNHDIGFLPGSANEKVEPYMKGFRDNLEIIKSLDPKNAELIEEWERKEKITIEPLVHIKGRSISNSFFIVDETQNNTPLDVKAITTRAGEGTKMIFTGDVNQIDNPYLDQSSNGLMYLISRMKGQSVFAHVNLVKGERSYLAELTADLL